MTYTQSSQETKPADVLQINLHPKQLEIYHDTHRFKVIACGRRFGKTKGCARVSALKALTTPGLIVWFIAPTFPQTMYLWREVQKIIPKKYILQKKEGEKYIELVNGSTIWAKSGDNPDGLVGEGLGFCVIDEAARVSEEVWKIIRPSLMDTHGECWFLSTPKGKNWFYRLYLREKRDERYKSFNYTSYDNPLLDKEEIKSLEEEFGDEISYRQEILARFLDSGGIVFRSLRKCLGECLHPPIPSHSYVQGVDLGKHQDFTVITVGDTTTNEIVFYERFNVLDWGYQKSRVKDVSTLYNKATVVLDTTGIGDVIYDDLTDMGVSIEPYKFTNVTKKLLISNYMRTMDNSLVYIPKDPDIVEEHEAFEYNISESGLTTYGAPSGMHDDTVISCALTVWGFTNAAVNVVGVIGDMAKTEPTPSAYDEEDLVGYDDEDPNEYPRYGVNRVRLGNG